MSQYSNLKVKQVIKETDEAITIVFEHPKEKVLYHPGQFLTLILPIDGEKHRRSYSLSSSPSTDAHPAVTVKKVAGGKVSTYLVNTIKAGDSIEVMQPMGTFTIECAYQNSRNIVLIGAGSGITPLISMAKAVLSQEPLSNVYMIYGNRNENTIIFKEQLNGLKNEHGDRFHLIHVLSQPLTTQVGLSGRLNQSAIIKLLETFPKLNFSAAEYFICGPQGIMDEARKALDILKVPADRIHKESFVSGTESNTSTESHTTASGEIREEEVTILYQGSEYKITVAKGKTILEAALDEDIDLPYSCQSGMCTACMGRCTSGKVKLNDPDGLSDKEIQQGFVLTCVGQPASSNVVIEID